MSCRCLKFSFDNPKVSVRFMDGVLALKNMKGVTITTADTPHEKAGLKFSFDNPEVAGRFIDGVLALENMKGVTITIDDSDAEATPATESPQIKPPAREEMWAHLRALPTPSADVLISDLKKMTGTSMEVIQKATGNIAGNMMVYYVEACYDYMCRHGH